MTKKERVLDHEERIFQAGRLGLRPHALIFCQEDLHHIAVLEDGYFAEGAEKEARRDVAAQVFRQQTGFSD
jgi:hypothetical protein